MITTNRCLQSESSADDDTDVSDYSTSEEEEEDSTSREEDNEDETSNNKSSPDEDESASSSEDEEIYKIMPTNVETDPTLVKIRLLIKRAHELVVAVRESSHLYEYVRQEKKEKKLPGDVSNGL